MAFKSLLGWLVFLSLSVPLTVTAQVIPDATLGRENSRVQRETIRGRDRVLRDSDLIEGGARRGRNLFHSFERFDVVEGRAAYFDDPAGVENIFSRVTGAERSEIRGVLGVLRDANLFLMNPNGIVFGPNAQLDVGGSFAATTANAIEFGELGFFSATNPEVPSPLLEVDPSAFFFKQVDGANVAGGITNQANVGAGLRVRNGENLLLLGGNVVNDGGNLSAFEGRIEIGAVAGTGAVELNPDGSLSFPTVLARGDVSFANGSRVDVRFNNAGDIGVTARNIEVSGQSRLLAGIFTDAGAVGSQAGDLMLNATGDIRVQQASRIANDVGPDPTGNGGDVNITTRSLLIEDGSQLSASTFGQGDAGSVRVNATDTVSLDGSNTTIFSNVAQGGVGTGGNVDITTRSLTLTNGAQLVANTRGRGDAGNVTVNATDALSLDGSSGTFPSAIFSRVDQNGVGAGGNVDITTRSLTLTNGAQLSASTRGQGDAGSVRDNATDAVSLDGNSTAILSSVGQSGVGAGGNVDITTRTLTLTNGAQLAAGTFGQGNAGNVIVNATDAVSLDGVSREGLSSAIFASATTTATGRGNAIFITTPLLRLSNGAVINASTANNQPGGNITVNANVLEVTRGGQLITATLGAGQAGNITLNAERVTLSGRDDSFAQRLEEFGRGRTANEENGASGLFANTRAGSTGLGGRIVLNLDDLILSDQARISAQSQGTGAAGGVTIRASEDVTLNNRSRISTESQARNARAGDIQITAGNTFTATNSDVSTSAANASGGDIRLTTRDVRLFGDSDIRTNSARNGGNITVNADTVVALDDSDIFASAAQGRGGNITLNTPAFFGDNYQPEASENAEVSELDNNNRVDLNATGTVSSGTISTPDTSFIQNSLSDLTENVVNTDSLIANSCIARNETGGTFLITGTGGLPPRPGSASLSTYPTGAVRTEAGEAESSSWQPGDAIVEPQGVYRLPDGRLVLSRECAFSVE